MPERVLITGVSGFIALHILEKLLKDETYQVRGTVRSLSNPKKIDPIKNLVPDAKYPVELVEAELLTDKGWAEAVRDCDYVLHTASPFFSNNSSSGEDELVKPAIEGTQRVLKACGATDSKVKRVVLTSSCASTSYGVKHEQDYVYTEKDWSDPNSDTIDTYSKSKTLAEKSAWDFVEANKDGHQFELTTINPCLVVGKFFGNTGTSVEIVMQMMNGSFPLIPNLHIGFVDVEDVATAHIAAIANPDAAGERFIIRDTEYWLKEAIAILREEFESMGYSFPSQNMPYFLAYVGSWFDSNLTTVTKTWGTPVNQDGSKAERVLGIKYKPAKQSLLETAYCLIEKGVLEKKEGYKPNPQYI